LIDLPYEELLVTPLWTLIIIPVCVFVNAVYKVVIVYNFFVSDDIILKRYVIYYSKNNKVFKHNTR